MNGLPKCLHFEYLETLLNGLSQKACAVACVSAGILGSLLWSHYRISAQRHLPDRDLGFPVFGHTLSVWRSSLEVWAPTMMKDRKVLLTNFLFSNVVIVKYDVYLKHMHRAELDGEFVPALAPPTKAIIGKHSVLSLPGGKGHPVHKRLRTKILASLGPKATLALIPDMISMFRKSLDELVTETQEMGFATFEPVASKLAASVSSLPITAGLDPKLQMRVDGLLNEVATGVFGLPVDLGRFNVFGRSLRAKRQLTEIVRGLMQSPSMSRHNIIHDLVQATADGEAFTLDEMVDSVNTLLLAGKLTTSDALPALVANLHLHSEWRERIAKEPLEFHAIEEDSATLRFVRESLRMKPPVAAYRRMCPEKPVDLGEFGSVPAGCPMAIMFRSPMDDMGPDFDPDRWTPEAVRESFLIFGGPQPHNCIGKNLAIIELQLFVRVLCREYDFEALDTTLVVRGTLTRSYKDGLRIKVTRKAAPNLTP